MNTSAKPILIKYEGNLIRYICPKCKQTIQFKKAFIGRSLCMKCGQRLDWSPVHDICSVVIETEDPDEAAWIANEYYKANGMNEEDWIETDTIRKTMKAEKTELYFLFLNPKSKGRFMRRYAKEGIIHDG